MRNELWLMGNFIAAAVMIWVGNEHSPSIGVSVGFALAVLVDIRAGVK